MNTLSTNSIKDSIHAWQDMKIAIEKLSSNNNFPVSVHGLHGALLSFFIAEYTKRLSLEVFKNSISNGINVDTRLFDVVIVVPTEYEATIIKTDLSTIFPDSQIILIPWWGIIPYRQVAKNSSIFGDRASSLANLSVSQNIAKNKSRIFVITQRAFQSPLPPPEVLRKNTFYISKNEKLDTVKITQHLSYLGYMRVSRVHVQGEFSLRGEVLDIFIPGNENPFRIIFDFDTVEQIKTFDTDSQTTLKSSDSIFVTPMKEIIWDDSVIETLKQKIDEYEKNALSTDNTNLNSDNEAVHLPLTQKAKEMLEKMIEELYRTKSCEGEEFFYSLLWDKKYTIQDYVGNNTPILFCDFDRMLNAEENILREYEGMYRKARAQFPVFAPEQIFMKLKNILANLQKCIYIRTIAKSKEEESEKNNCDINFSSDASRNFFGNILYLKDELKKLLEDDWKVVIYADGENQQKRIKELLIDIKNENNDESAINKNYLLEVLPDAISHGFSIRDLKLLVIQENEIFGRRHIIPKSLKKTKSSVIDTFVELNHGDYVVHVQFGIGIFRGIERVKTVNNERDYVKLEYADKEIAFVPIEQVNMVQRYIGSDSDNPKIDRLGSKSWENRKNKVKQSVEDLAKKLIDLYSRRQAARGFPFPKDTQWQTSFEASFPYEDTVDQATVTEEIKSDMEKPIPMDRLVCGDVGYGKTEIAMRSAFKAVMGGKQVAFLAPTTILAEQHYETFTERFENFPVQIAVLSRFVSRAEQKKMLEKLKAGNIDILIGTHRIIQKDVIFKNLGLLIIDEEQRFGVKDKEKLKEIKSNIDCLALSATPIPRTLHMSLLKIRDMSLLTTPPQNRQPIETTIEPYSDEKVALAIRNEVERGGQIFFLHNRVDSLFEIKYRLEQLVPEMLIDIAHGQMSSDELENIFRRFKLGGFHVLVSTTIIENGIDIPNVNTIIIDRADMYGVSQLYQLRGRVGRSDRKAYAYLLYPENTSLSEVAMKRLQVISDFTELGSGFKIAMKDMEIRGAGNLLGKDQSGDVYSVGFELYLKLLNEAVERLTAQENYKEQNEVLMEMEYTGFIPDTYVQNTQTKMEIYKKIASIQTDDELIFIMNELEDRFGSIPDEVLSLLSLAEIRILCKNLCISSIKEKQGIVEIEFARVSEISIDKVLKLIKDSAGDVNLDSTKPNMLFLKLGKIGLKEKSEYIREKLERLK